MRISLRGILRSPEFQPLAVMVIICIILIALPLSYKSTLSRLGLSSVLYPFIEVDTFLRKIDTTFETNKYLNRRLDYLSTIVSSMIENKYENERLRKMLGFNVNQPLDLIPAEVFAVTPTGRFNSILINVGKSSGVKANMPVITPSGIVGKTISAEENYAVVQLLYDPAFKVAARTQSGRVQGIASYAGGRFLALTNVPYDLEVSIGDTVISSGLGGIFPRGLYIGQIIEAQIKEGELFKDIQILPGANFSVLEEVFVVLSGEESR